MSSAGQVQKPRCSVLPFAFQVLSQWFPSAATFQLLPFWEKFLVLLHVKFIGRWTLVNSSMEQLLSKGVFGWGLCLVDLPVQSLLQMYLAKGCGLGPGQL